MTKKRRKLMADLETTVTPDDVHAWAVGVVDIDTNEVAFVGTNLHDFFTWLSTQNTVCYFHNLKFDGEFLLSYLLREGFTPSKNREPKTFETLITDTGQFYSITVIFGKQGKQYKKVVFYDSLKKLPFKVAVIADAFKLPKGKGSIDYEAYREPGHELTDEERDYLVTDCSIVAQALKIQMDEGLTKMTNASDAMSWFKKSIGKSTFEGLFPVFPIALDDDLRRAYKGGFVYLKPEHRSREGLQGLTLDINSLYPSVMYNDLLPYGYPVYFEGEPVPDDRYPLFIVRMRCWFELKPGHIPTIQLKNNRAFVETEYLTSSNDEIVEMTLTNVDLALFKDHYNIECEEYLCGWKFKGKHGIFKDYIDHWMRIKETETGAKRQLAKLMLNSLYGKFATNPHGRKKVPRLEDDMVRFSIDEDDEDRDPVYTPMGAFITSYARNKTIRSAQGVYDRFIYADTDSLHLIGWDEPEELEIHPTRLGAWKNEGRFTRSKYIRAKTYMETMHETKPDTLKNYVKVMCAGSTEWMRREPDGIHYGQIKVTCAGMPDNIKANVTYENFTSGSCFDGKLVPRRYPGGVILEKTTFTIK